MGFLERLFRFSAGPQPPDPLDSPQQAPDLPGRDDDRCYRVKEGDTLEAIASEIYGDPAAWRRIAEANRNSLGDPAVLYPGLVLDLP